MLLDNGGGAHMGMHSWGRVDRVIEGRQELTLDGCVGFRQSNGVGWGGGLQKFQAEGSLRTK